MFVGDRVEWAYEDQDELTNQLRAPQFAQGVTKAGLVLKRACKMLGAIKSSKKCYIQTEYD